MFSPGPKLKTKYSEDDSTLNQYGKVPPIS